MLWLGLGPDYMLQHCLQGALDQGITDKTATAGSGHRLTVYVSCVEREAGYAETWKILCVHLVHRDEYGGQMGPRAIKAMIGSVL